MKLKFSIFRTVFNRFTSSNLAYYSIKSTFRYHLHLSILSDNAKLKAYADQIITLSVFLFISASFMKKTTKDRYLDFDWKSYFNVFKSDQMRRILLCSIVYLLESGRIFENRKEIKDSLKGVKDTFVNQYLDFFQEANTGGHVILDEEVDFVKYMRSLELVLKIHDIYHKEIPKDSSKVVDLVYYTTKWKSEILDLFQHKAEYIMFSFFLNLSR